MSSTNLMCTSDTQVSTEFANPQYISSVPQTPFDNEIAPLLLCFKHYLPTQAISTYARGGNNTSLLTNKANPPKDKTFEDVEEKLAFIDILNNMRGYESNTTSPDTNGDCSKDAHKSNLLSITSEKESRPMPICRPIGTPNFPNHYPHCYYIEDKIIKTAGRIKKLNKKQWWDDKTAYRRI